jgi:hypothetical protein
MSNFSYRTTEMNCFMYGCKEAALGTLYCVRHMPICEYDGCKEKTMNMFCLGHKCAVSYCQELGEVAGYCSAHAHVCPRCPARVGASGLMCFEHERCQACGDTAVPPFAYCHKHMCKSCKDVGSGECRNTKHLIIAK